MGVKRVRQRRRRQRSGTHHQLPLAVPVINCSAATALVSRVCAPLSAGGDRGNERRTRWEMGADRLGRGKESYKQTNKGQTVGLSFRHTKNKYRETEIKIYRQTDRKKDRQTDTQTDRGGVRESVLVRERERKREKDRKTDRQRDKLTDRRTDRDRHSEAVGM